MAQNQEVKVGPQKNLEDRSRQEAWWRRLISEQPGSGLNHTAFCRSRSLSPALYFWWRREIGIRDGKLRPREKNCRPASIKPASVGFVPVSFMPSATAVPGAGSEKFEVVLGKDRLVRVPANFDTEALKRLIACLEGAC